VRFVSGRRFDQSGLPGNDPLFRRINPLFSFRDLFKQAFGIPRVLRKECVADQPGNMESAVLSAVTSASPRTRHLLSTNWSGAA
jgi:hypothetical protein